MIFKKSKIGKIKKENFNYLKKMNINCQLLENGDYSCSFDQVLPEYITLIENPSGSFYFSNVLTPTDFLLVFFFIILFIYILIKTVLKFVFNKVVFMKQKI